jgi:hypothetical protein
MSASFAEIDQGTLLGLYHGYDQARLELAKLVTRFGTGASSDDDTRRRIWSRAKREGLSLDLFEAPTHVTLEAPGGLNRGAHSAALTAFATISEKAEELLRTLQARWPELCEDAGGPLPTPNTWDPTA